MLIRPVYRPRLPSLAQGLVGWWPFDDASGFDQSAAHNNGTLISSPVPLGGAAPGVGGRPPGALKFNGSTQYMRTSPGTTLSLPKWTLGFWINGNSAPGNGSVVTAVLKSAIANSNNVNYGFDWSHTSAGFKQAFFYSTSSGGTFFSAQLTSTLLGSVWYHILGTYDGANLRAYLNGQLQATTATSSTPDTSTDQFCIGAAEASATTGTNFFAGAMDDVRIYNRALSAGEILALYSEAFQPLIDIETIALMHGQYGAGAAFQAAWAVPSNFYHGSYAT